jgi:hypothetical protein
MLFLMLTMVLLFGCKPVQTATTSNLHQVETSAVRDSSVVRDSTSVLSEQVVKMLAKEYLNIVVKQIIYDTQQAVDSATHRPPVASDTEITIVRRLQTDSSDSLMRNETETKQALTGLQATTGLTIDAKTTEKTKTGLSTIQKILLWTGAIAIIAVIIYSVIKFKFKWI